MIPTFIVKIPAIDSYICTTEVYFGLSTPNLDRKQTKFEKSNPNFNPF